MADENARRTPRMTPIPTADLSALVASVARTEENVKVIKDTLIPPLVEEARDARNLAHDVSVKVDAHLEDTSAHIHTCKERTRQERQDTAIGSVTNKVATTNVKVASSSKLLWWLLGIVVLLVGAGVSFAIVINTDVVRSASAIERQDTSIREHGDAIKVLTATQERDRELYLREVQNIPNKITKIIAESNESPDIRTIAEDLPLTPQEQRQLSEIIDRARQRDNGRTDGVE